MIKSKLTILELTAGILAGDISILSRAITLIESKKEEDTILASNLITNILSFSGKSIRLGITGAPGVGKSTFIDRFGAFLISKGKKVAVLAIDPTSKISGGSILGDKTRMEKLLGQKNAFIRPSPAGIELGGVAQTTLESILLCEAAGFDFILIETVGVGQSEITVKEITDFFIFLTIAGRGDELQGIKRGIMEMVDLVVINKSDQIEKNVLKNSINNLNFALHLFPKKESNIQVSVLPCSALNEKGFDDIFNTILNYQIIALKSNYFSENRKLQNVSWMNRILEKKILNYFNSNAIYKTQILKAEKEILENKNSPIIAAKEIFEIVIKKMVG